jgi:hypothetical protein
LATTLEKIRRRQFFTAVFTDFESGKMNGKGVPRSSTEHLQIIHEVTSNEFGTALLCRCRKRQVAS